MIFFRWLQRFLNHPAVRFRVSVDVVFPCGSQALVCEMYGESEWHHLPLPGDDIEIFGEPYSVIKTAQSLKEPLAFVELKPIVAPVEADVRDLSFDLEEKGWYRTTPHWHRNYEGDL